MSVTGKFVAAILAYGVAGSLAAQENVSTTKSKMGIFDKVSSQTGNVELRHYVETPPKAGEHSKVEHDVVKIQTRANLGVGLFDDVVNTTLTLGATHSSSDANQEIIQRRPRVLTEVKAIDSTWVALTPYLDLHLPFDGEGTRGDLGITPMVRVPAIDTVFGSIALSTRVEAESQFTSRKEDAQVTNADEAKKERFSLVEDEDKNTVLTDVKGGPTYEVRYIPEVAVKLDKVVKGLGLRLWIENAHEYVPQYELEDDGTRNKIWKDNHITESYYEISYAVTDALVVLNAFSTTHNGFYEGRGTGKDPRYTNLAMLSYKLY